MAMTDPTPFPPIVPDPDVPDPVVPNPDVPEPPQPDRSRQPHHPRPQPDRLTRLGSWPSGDVAVDGVRSQRLSMTITAAPTTPDRSPADAWTMRSWAVASSERQ